MPEMDEEKLNAAFSTNLLETKRISFVMLTLLIAFVTSCNVCYISGEGLVFRTLFAAVDVYFCVLLEATLWQVIFCDPGFVASSNCVEDCNLRGETVCLKCGAAKFNYAHHCRKCDRCVELYDHHCNVFANCFGARSIGFVFKFLIMSGLFLALSVAQLIPVNVQNYRSMSQLRGWAWFVAFYGMMLSFYELVGSIILFILAFRLCSNQLFMGIGTIERRSGMDTNGRPWKSNFRRYFGSRCLLRFLIPLQHLGPEKSKE